MKHYSMLPFNTAVQYFPSEHDDCDKMILYNFEFSVSKLPEYIRIGFGCWILSIKNGTLNCRTKYICLLKKLKAKLRWF